MAWCRWSDAKTCCEYLITRSISNEIDPSMLLYDQQSTNEYVSNNTDIDSINKIWVNLASEFLSSATTKHANVLK